MEFGFCLRRLILYSKYKIGTRNYTFLCRYLNSLTNIVAYNYCSKRDVTRTLGWQVWIANSAWHLTFADRLINDLTSLLLFESIYTYTAHGDFFSNKHLWWWMILESLSRAQGQVNEFPKLSLVNYFFFFI